MKQEPKERKAGKELQMSVKGSDEEAVSLPGGCSHRAPGLILVIPGGCRMRLLVVLKDLNDSPCPNHLQSQE